MNRIIIRLIVFFSIAAILLGQKSEGGKPYSSSM